MDYGDNHELIQDGGAIRIEPARLLKDGGYGLSANHALFEQPILLTVTPASGEGWQMTAWIATQTHFEDDTWSFPHLEATPLDSQVALERVLRRVAGGAADDPHRLCAWVFEISSGLARVLRTVTLYDRVDCAWRAA